MKKLTLSLFVIVTFAGFGLYRWLQTSTEVVILVTPEPTQSSLPTPYPTAKPSPTVTPSAGATPPPRPTATPTPVITPKKLGQYVDGQYTGSVADAYYGNIQVRATIQNGLITDVVFLQYPNDRSTSREINGQAMPMLRQEAIQAQSANVHIVSGATDSSGAFRESLASALAKAQ